MQQNNCTLDFVFDTREKTAINYHLLIENET